MTTTFWLGHQDMLEPEHVGRVIQIDLYAFDRYQPKDGTKLRMHTYVGTLAGFSEDRGAFVYGPDDLGYQGAVGATEFPDISVHDYIGGTIFLTDGRRITVEENDYAQIFLPEIKKEVSA